MNIEFVLSSLISIAQGLFDLNLFSETAKCDSTDTDINELWLRIDWNDVNKYSTDFVCVLSKAQIHDWRRMFELRRKQLSTLAEHNIMMRFCSAFLYI